MKPGEEIKGGKFVFFCCLRVDATRKDTARRQAYATEERGLPNWQHDWLDFWESVFFFFS